MESMNTQHRQGASPNVEPAGASPKRTDSGRKPTQKEPQGCLPLAVAGFFFILFGLAITGGEDGSARMHTDSFWAWLFFGFMFHYLLKASGRAWRSFVAEVLEKPKQTQGAEQASK